MPTLPDDYLEFEKADFQRTVLVKEIGWHPVEIVKYELKKTKAGDADLRVFDLKGLDEDTGRKGIFLRFQVSSKAPKWVMSMLVAALDPEARKQEGYKFKPENAVGKRVDAYINHRRMDEDDAESLTNNVKDFRPLS